MKRGLIALIILTILMTVVPFAMAQESNHSFKAPTSRVDNTELLPEEIGGFDIKVDGVIMSSSQMTPPTTEKYSISGTSRSFTVDLLPGNHIINIITVDTEGRRSNDGAGISVDAKAPPSAMTVDDIGNIRVTVTVEIPAPGQ